MKKRWIAFTVIGIVAFFLFTSLAAWTYSQHGHKVSENEVVTYGSMLDLALYIIFAVLSVFIIIFGTYKICKGN